MKYWKKRSYKMCIAPVVGVFLFAGLFKIAIECETGRLRKVDGRANPVITWQKRVGLQYQSSTFNWSFSKGPFIFTRNDHLLASRAFEPSSLKDLPLLDFSTLFLVDHSNRLNGWFKCITVHFHISRAPTLKFFCPLSVSQTFHFNKRPAY